LGIVSQGGFKTLRHVHYNTGNIFLFQKDYGRACVQYEDALAGVKNYGAVVNYLISYGIALYFLNRADEAGAFLSAIEGSRGSKHNASFEPFFYMWKICMARDDEKGAYKYRKMYVTRLKKYSQREIECAAATMEDRGEIMADYEGPDDGRSEVRDPRVPPRRGLDHRVALPQTAVEHLALRVVAPPFPCDVRAAVRITIHAVVVAGVVLPQVHVPHAQASLPDGRGRLLGGHAQRRHQLPADAPSRLYPVPG